LIKASDAAKVLISNSRFQATLDVDDWREPPSAVVLGIRRPGELDKLTALNIVHFAEALGQRRSGADAQELAVG
jgi:hypothetical protein